MSVALKFVLIGENLLGHFTFVPHYEMPREKSCGQQKHLRFFVVLILSMAVRQDLKSAADKALGLWPTE